MCRRPAPENTVAAACKLAAELRASCCVQTPCRATATLTCTGKSSAPICGALLAGSPSCTATAVSSRLHRDANTSRPHHGAQVKPWPTAALLQHIVHSLARRPDSLLLAGGAWAVQSLCHSRSHLTQVLRVSCALCGLCSRDSQLVLSRWRHALYPRACRGGP